MEFPKFPKKLTVEEICYIIVSNCVHKNYPKDSNFLNEELTYVKYFAFDYGTALKLGMDNPIRNAILDSCLYQFAEMTESGTLPPWFIEKLDQRLYSYTIAVKTCSKPLIEDVSHAIGEMFVSCVNSSQGRTELMPQEAELIGKSSTMFLGVVTLILKLLKTAKILY